MSKLLLLTTLFIHNLFSSQAYINNNKLLKYKKNYTVITIDNIDKYIFFYNSKNKSCELSKNGLSIELFDPRFNIKKPKTTTQRCATWIKEQYSNCKVSNNVFVSSVAMAFGKYENTNLLIGFNVLHPNLDGIVKVQCTK